MSGTHEGAPSNTNSSWKEATIIHNGYAIERDTPPAWTTYGLVLLGVALVIYGTNHIADNGLITGVGMIGVGVSAIISPVTWSQPSKDVFTWGFVIDLLCSLAAVVTGVGYLLQSNLVGVLWLIIAAFAFYRNIKSYRHNMSLFRKADNQSDTEDTILVSEKH